MYSQELKISTEKIHFELEQRLIPVIQNVKSLPQYAALLKLFFGFYSPLEKQLSNVSDIENVFADIRLRKADRLKTDILAIEPHVKNVLLCDNLPKAVDLSSALGILYVLEGSTLGGIGIASILRKNLAIDTLPFSFFFYYGNDTKKMWDQFKDKLDSTSNLRRPELLYSAFETFRLFKTWVEKNDSCITMAG
jgi:heme oxygenase